MIRPISPNTQEQYNQLLSRAFVDPAEPTTLRPEVSSWPNSVKKLLRSATARRLRELEIPPDAVLRQIQLTYEERRVVQGLTEPEIVAWEAQALAERPGKRSVALLLLALGLRANEALTIARETAETALVSGELKVLRKGGKERLLPAQGIVEVLQELLSTPAAPGRKRLNAAAPAPAPWKIVGEIFNRGKRISQYHSLHEIVATIGRKAGLKRHVRPHLLRHAFATRMKARGMPDLQIQAMMGHASFTTTARYLHGDLRGADKFLSTIRLSGA